MIAASLGNLEAIDILIENNANIHLKHKFAGSTALHFAAEMNQAESIKKLCEFGADAGVVNSIGKGNSFDMICIVRLLYRK